MAEFTYREHLPTIYTEHVEDLAALAENLDLVLVDFIRGAADAPTDYPRGSAHHLLSHWRKYDPSPFARGKLDMIITDGYVRLFAWDEYTKFQICAEVDPYTVAYFMGNTDDRKDQTK